MSNQNRKNMEFIHYCNTKLSNINEYNIIKVKRNGKFEFLSRKIYGNKK